MALEPNNGGILLDLSPKGMRISVARPLHTDTQMHFSFGASPLQQVQGIGRIAWIDRSKKSAGICFVHLSEESLTKIDELLKSASLEAVAEPSPQAHISGPSPEPQVAFSQRVAIGQPEVHPFSFESVRAMASADCATANDSGNLNHAGAGLDAIGELTIPTSVATEEAPYAPETEDAETDSFRPSGPASTPLGTETYEPDAEPVSGDTDKNTRSTPTDAKDANTPGRDYEPVAQPPDSLSGQTGETAVANGVLAPQPCGLNDPLPVFTLTPTYQCPPSRLALMGKAVLPALHELGWGLENDWHVVAGLVLVAVGFIALWQRPPLVPLAIALWIAAALVLTDKKQPRHNADL